MKSAENALYTALLPSQFQDSTDVTDTTTLSDQTELTLDGTSQLDPFLGGRQVTFTTEIQIEPLNEQDAQYSNGPAL